jgi:hypothetical protein
VRRVIYDHERASREQVDMNDSIEQDPVEEQDESAGPLSRGEWTAIIGGAGALLALGLFVLLTVAGVDVFPPGGSAAPTPNPTASVDTSSWAYRQGQAVGDQVAQSYGFRAAPDGTVTQCEPKNEASSFVSSPADKANFDAGFVMACKARARDNAGLPVG